jgi:hypothetical protein
MGAEVRCDPGEPGAVVVRVPGPARSSGAVTLGGGRFGAEAVEALLRADLASWSQDGTRLLLSEPGRARLAREHAAPQERYLAQHTVLADARIAGEAVRIDAEESPLDWMRRRKGPDGAPLLDAAAYEAGERLRRDLARSGLLPRVTARWESPVGGGRFDPAGATDAMITARQRVGAALEAVGEDFADLLLDLCGFLKGLETLERDRGWPARSGKVVVRLALSRLARHYGLSSEARGRSSAGIRVWRDAAAMEA